MKIGVFGACTAGQAIRGKTVELGNKVMMGVSGDRRPANVSPLIGRRD